MKIKAPDALLAAEVSRRGLMKTTAIGGLALASNALTLPFTRLSHAADTPAPASEKVVWSACTVNCGSRCPLRMHVVDGAIKYVETDNTGDDNYDGLHQVRACLRGRSMRRRVYNPDRLKYPMKRVGKRGEGKFEQISWEEALDTIASNMQRLIKEYGNESIYLNYGTGTLGGTLTRSWPPGKTLPAGAPANGHYKAYILGQGTDGIAKTPEWASTITGIPRERIVKLAREIATAKPAYISQGWGPQRHANGEIATRAISMLAILTGNVGINGGNSGAREGSYSLPFERMPTLENPVETSISMFMWTDAIERGPEMTALRDGVRGKDKLDVPIKMIWNYAGNCLINQHSEINRTHEILQDDKKCEMIVVIDCHMTSSAKYADILLPDCTASEQMDFALDASCGNMSYVIFADQAIKPRFECKTIYEMTSELAKRLGVEEQFTEGRTQEGWMRYLYEQSRKAIPDLPDFDTFRQQGIYKQRDPQGHHVAYKAFREDPQANPLTTPSGKIEIYSQDLAKIAATWELPEGDVIDPLPIYTPGFENYNDPLTAKYPLQLTGFHYKSRVHSTYGNVDVLKAACRQEMWINPIDARKRGIANGDRIRIFNDRGEVHIEAKVTPRMMPGVVALGEGAWYNPDASRVDQAGSINVLTTQRPSPLAKGNPSHTNLVQVEKL
ncbi:DMSO/selenate family reductase complex A subunit [Klebsiella pneumoniae]|uniref:DMSO/selenate family reductase complex A subunit n=1 Tax=Klebsiella pneumoniae TaxID=573 RepID=UPI000671D654|nr:DMSO/selenate family reductase complex A subunit [Klebsiella pneumoniae]KMX52988.1 dimethyl sulfoxide reductase DmsA [Klebsiella pneumoniae]